MISKSKQVWRIAGPLVVVLLLVVATLYQHTVLYLAGLWNQIDIGEYAHGYLVLAISVYLIFSSRQKLSALTPCPEYRAWLLVVAASMLWMVAALVNVEMIQAVALLLLVLAVVWVVLGNQVIRVLAFPILFMAFAIPIWFPLSPVLQNIAADAVFGAIRFLSVPAFRQDNMIVLPAGTLSIEEACSGLRYLLAALTLGTLYAYMNYSSLRARVIVVVVSAASAVLANMLRVFIVVYLGYTTDMQHPLVHDHLSLGWYLFGGLVVILLFVDAWLHKKHLLTESAAQVELDDVKVSVCKQGFSRYILFVGLTGLLVSAAPAFVYKASQASANVTENVPPEQVPTAGWVKTVESNDNWEPVFHGAINQKQVYKKGNDELVFYIGYYPVQKQGEELINELNTISDKKMWRKVYPKAKKIKSDGQPMLEQLISNRANQQRLVWYWYNVAGRVTTNKYEAKLLQIIGLLSGDSWAYVVAVSAQTGDDVDATRRVLEDFVLLLE